MALALVLVLLEAAGGLRAAEPAPLNRRFLVVYEHDSTLVANIQVAAGIEAVLSRDLPGREVYSEYMDLARFPDPSHGEGLAAAMAAKYGGLPMDAVLAAGPGALAFVLEHRNGFAPATPVIFGGVTAESAQRFDLPPEARGVISGFDVRQPMDLARRLQPDARRVVVVTGSAPFDRTWQARAREELSDHRSRIEISFVSDLSLAGFQEMARALDRTTILLILTVFEDAEGRTFVPRNAAAAIAKASAAPAYGVYSSYLGAGLLGGYVETFGSIGETMAEMAIQAAAGEDDGPVLVETVPRPVVDWRQMRRFGIDASGLPPGTERLYYEPTAWERYKPQILLACVIILLQSATIAALVIQERRRRRIAEELAVEAMAELPPAERRMDIETRARKDGFRELAVADRGGGLLPEMRANAFKPFVSTKQHGLGFGLSICRSIAQAHGGTLAFEERAVVGARVVLTLPPP
jgi:hypothetical protein